MSLSLCSTNKTYNFSFQPHTTWILCDEFMILPETFSLPGHDDGDEACGAWVGQCKDLIWQKQFISLVLKADIVFVDVKAATTLRRTGKKRHSSCLSTNVAFLALVMGLHLSSSSVP